MSLPSRSIRVIQLPAFTTPKLSKAFLKKLRRYAEDPRPCSVLDCSAAGKLTIPLIELMVGALEEAMKSNGDVRLAGLNPRANASLIRTGASGLFETFDTIDLAVSSFRRAASMAPLVPGRSAKLLVTDAAGGCGGPLERHQAVSRQVA